jgi:hypothetical protein
MKIQRISEELDFDRRFRTVMIVGDFVSFPNSSKFFISEKVEILYANQCSSDNSPERALTSMILKLSDFNDVFVVFSEENTMWMARWLATSGFSFCPKSVLSQKMRGSYQRVQKVPLG